MLPDRPDGAGLRPFVALLDAEADRGACLEACEAAIKHAVAMEVDVPPVGRRNDAAVALGIDREHFAVRLLLVRFHIAAADAHLVLELAPGRSERLAHSDVHILVGVIGGRLPARDDLATRA